MKSNISTHASFVPAPRILRQHEVSHVTGVPKSTMYAWIARGDFPKPVKLGRRAAGWIAGDVEAWLQSRQIAA